MYFNHTQHTRCFTFFSPYDQIFYPQNNFSFFYNPLFIYLFICLLISITGELKASFLICLPLCVRMSTSSLLVRLFVSMFCLCLRVFFLCLFGCLTVIIFVQCLYCYRKFWFSMTVFIFTNHHLSCIISFFHMSIGGKFDTVNPSIMVYLYPSILQVCCLS